MQHPAEQSPLGKTSAYISEYDPAQLYAIARQTKWTELGIDSQALPYYGVDIWNSYELSWLLPSGKPVVAVAEIRVPAQSPNIIESKSFKLYLNSFNQSVFASFNDVQSRMADDLSRVAGVQVSVTLLTLDQACVAGVHPIVGTCIDDLDVAINQYGEPSARVLSIQSQPQVSETLYSHLLKSNCPVTGQPDWGTVVVQYKGAKLCAKSLLMYLVSFRQHQDFHEQCVERIFMDLRMLLQPEHLTVYARYVRRGGLDINPYRSTDPIKVENTRLVRQ